MPHDAFYVKIIEIFSSVISEIRKKKKKIKDWLFILFDSIFQDFSKKKKNILYILWFYVSRLFILHTYKQNPLHYFNSPFTPFALLPLYIYLLIALHVIPCQIYTNQKWCHLPSIFWRHLLNSNIIVSFNSNPYELTTTKEERLAFYTEWQWQLKF